MKPKTYPLSINGYIKPSNTLCRDRRCMPKKKGKVVLTDRSNTVRGLDVPELISSIHGPIKRILFTIPNWVFKEQDNSMGKKSAALFQYLLKTLSHAQVLIVINERSQDKLNNWIEKFNINPKVIYVGDEIDLSIWAEDSYCICHDMHDAENYIIEPLAFKNAQKDIATIVANADKELIIEDVDLYFEGGNMLIGDDFWLMGVDSVNLSLEYDYITVRKGECKTEAVKRAYKCLDHHRELHVIGSKFETPVAERRAIKTVDNKERDWTGWEEVLYKGNDYDSKQPIFHLDMFISLAGKNEDGKYQVLVASPKLAADLLKEDMPEGNMQEIFDEIADSLREKGFEVIRNPMPLIYDDDDNLKLREWYFASANNVLLQDQPKKTVWLPTYGYGNWEKLKVTDNKNKEIWEELGYNVMMLPDCHILAIQNGVVHCISKYLSRVEREQPLA